MSGRIEEAVRVFVAARRSGAPIDALPEAAKPADLAQAHAMQDATATALGDGIAGWKVAITAAGQVMRGAIFRSRLLGSPATLPAGLVPMLGVELEIAFRFDHDLPPRVADYTEAEVANAATALVGIEVVDSRFRSYADTPLLDRTADCMSNGAYVVGTSRNDWREFDLAALEATLSVNGAVVVSQRGGHIAANPILPAIPLVNLLRAGGGVRAGQIITTGTYTGLYRASPGDRVTGSFAGFGSAEIHFEETR
jgi:2-keto-4-pentenoate hydratase